MKHQTVAVNKFVIRQIKGSGKSYSESLSFQDMADHASDQLCKNRFKKGYRDGVILVPVSDELVHKFVCPFTLIDENTQLNAAVTRRRPEEAPYIQIRARNGQPVPAGNVDLVLYRHDVLAEDNDFSTDADWELIAFLVVPEGIDEMPMGPVTMMRNQLHLPGGTKALYTSDEWAESVNFWQKYAALED